MIYAIICIPIMWYRGDILDKYGLYLTIADFVLWVISTVHIIKNYKTYLKTQINCYFGTLGYMMLERTDILLKKHFYDTWYNDIMYFCLYVSIIVFVIVKSIVDNRQK